MDTINEKITINETIVVDDKVIDFIALANLASLKPQTVAGYLNSIDIACNATNKEYHWTEDRIKTVLETVTVDRELHVLGLEPDTSPVPWRGERIAGLLPPLTPEEEADREAATAALVTKDLTRLEVDEQIEQAHGKKARKWLKVLNQHSQTFGRERLYEHLRYLRTEVRTHAVEMGSPNPYLKERADAPE